VDRRGVEPRFPACDAGVFPVGPAARLQWRRWESNPSRQGASPPRHLGTCAPIRKGPPGSRTRPSSIPRRCAAETPADRFQWAVQDSNLQPPVCKTDALAFELTAPSAPPMGLEPTTFSVTGRRALRLLHGGVFQSGWPDSNRRSPGPEPGGLPTFPTSRSSQSTQRESNPHVHLGKVAGFRYIMSARQWLRWGSNPQHLSF
jgi:hypothetical protein